MTNREYYELKLPTIKAIPAEDAKRPHNVPVANSIQEAEELYVWAGADKDELVDAGLAWELVEDLPARSGTLIVAETLWQGEQNTRSEIVEKWRLLVPAAKDLRKELCALFRHAFGDNPTLMRAVTEIAKGKNHARLIQSLNDLSVLGKKNSALLEKKNFDFSLLDKAEEMSSECAPLLAAVVTEKDTTSETKRLRDQAYTHLKEAVDQIRAVGKLVFRLDKKRLVGYRSAYLRALKQKQRRKAKKTNN